MKAVILAGGVGTRLSEETIVRPKPMVEIGGKPILWHIMKIYSHFGINDFVICLGHRGYVIKEYFAHYSLHLSDVTIDIQENAIDVHQSSAEPWRITLVDTGPETMTGGRLARVRKYLDDEAFCMTYGDGLANVNVEELLELHKRENAIVTLTAVKPPGRFGALDLRGSRVADFSEKPAGDGGYINGGFFVCSPEVFGLIGGDDCVWEQGPLEDLARMGRLSAHVHGGFWQPMDTLRDRNLLESLWATGEAPWKLWR